VSAVVEQNLWGDRIAVGFHLWIREKIKRGPHGRKKMEVFDGKT
jgi:hypothetical protein